MDESEIASLSERGYEIGSHGTSHRRLTELSTEEIQNELQESHEILAEITDSHITSLAYPEGMYDDSVLEAVRSSDFRSAVTTDEDHCRAEHGHYQIPRISIDEKIHQQAFSVKTSSALKLQQSLSSLLTFRG
jgi:peptidoglycan/xylan/chitin deacetylase (PgdA/CDA1 family)